MSGLSGLEIESQYEFALKLATELFDGNRDQAVAWMYLKQDLLDHRSPLEVISVGHGSIVLDWLCGSFGEKPRSF